MEKSTITIRQLLIIFVSSTLSPAIRIFPSLSARLGHRAVWISPMLSALALYLICLILNACFQNKDVRNLSDVFRLSLGRVGGKILLALFFAWAMILYFLYIRYYAERLLASIFPNTDIRFFIITMMLVVALAARGKIEHFARFCEIMLPIFTLVLITFFIFLFSTVKIGNLLPVTHYDALPVLKATYPILGIWGYVTLACFLGEYVLNKEQMKRYSVKPVLYIGALAALILIFVVGSLGYQLSSIMSLPFFNATKLITFMETLDRTESLLLSVWVVSDFIVISLFALILMNIAKSLFAMDDSKRLSSPIVILGYFGSLMLASNRFELEQFTAYIGLPVNIALCFGVPALVLLIGKLRKKI